MTFSQSGGNEVERVTTVGASRGISPASARFVSKLPSKISLLSGRDVAGGQSRKLGFFRGVERKLPVK